MTAAAPPGVETEADLGSAVVALTRAMESADRATLGHAHRVRRYAIELARALDPSLLEDRRLESSFLFHDLGKTAIPDRILFKPGPLSKAERGVLEEHTILGERMLAQAGIDGATQLAVARSHHERWDGGGYPDGLVGPEIPLAARVVAVADALDAMTSDRPYCAARSWDSAVAEIVAESGTQFDPTIVDALMEHHLRLRRIHYELSARAARPPAGPAKAVRGQRGRRGNRRLSILVATVALAVAIAAVAVIVGGRSSDRIRAGPEDVELALFEEINRVRVMHGVRRLDFSRPLARAGHAHAHVLALTGQFTHDWPGGKPFRSWISRFYPVRSDRVGAAGENLLWTAPGLQAKDAVSRWLGSPPHRRVLLSRDWREIGIGIVEASGAAGVYGGRDVAVAAAEFGVRR